MKKFLSLVVCLIAISALRADRDRHPLGARAIASTSGTHFMLVVPVSERFESWFWTAYSVAKGGTFKEIWSADGIYGREMFLADDGLHVVCVESWPGGKMKQSDIVIATYEEGRLLKAYRTIDLVRDTSRIQRSVSHYRWLLDRAPLHVRGYRLSFTTIDEQSYELDMMTGTVTAVIP